MPAGIHFDGSAKQWLRNIAECCPTVLEAGFRRLLKGPRRPGWNLLLELATELLKRRMTTVFELDDVNHARRYLDSIVIRLPELADVDITHVAQEKFKGSWFTSKNADSVVVLYLHGGGYSFYPASYANVIAMIALATKARTFALDYSLAPERRFPAQLEEALSAYRWLLGSGADPEQLVFAGDSAGGNLTISALLAARDAKLPLPRLAMALSPPTDFETVHPSMERNRDYDWIDPRMLLRWADWFCDLDQRRNPLISPLWADLHGLPPIYIQAGRCEILYDSIQAFADRARSEGADVVLETWEDMNHIFQMFGRYVPQSAEALRRLGEVVDTQVRSIKTGQFDLTRL
jgi:epsilon-lactone hydrolase